VTVTGNEVSYEQEEQTPERWAVVPKVGDPLAEAAALYDRYVALTRVAEASMLVLQQEAPTDWQVGAPMHLVITEHSG
jgi:hypothetical protein